MMLQTAENGRIRSAENGKFCRRRQTETASKLPRAFLQNCLETTALVFGKMTTPFIHYHYHFIHSSMSFSHSFIHPSINPSIHPSISFILSSIHPSISFILSFIHSIHSFIHSFTHSFIHSFTHPFIHSFNHSLFIHLHFI